MSKSTHSNLAACSKCGIKHMRTVGIRCKRLLNISAPVVSDLQGDDQVNTSQQSVHEETATSTSSEGRESKSSQVESKLDLILKKMSELENKNHLLEKRLDERPHPSGSRLRLSHSSPKRSHACSRQCEHKPASKSRHSSKKVKMQESSDEECSMATPQASSTHLSNLSDSDLSVTQPSLQFLKEDDRTQQKVQKQLQKLQGQTRGTSSQGNKTFKSGLHRSGDNAIKVEIPWPHHHCFPAQGGNMPEYKDLSPIQFMIGFMGCIQEETSSSVKSNMLDYGRRLLQDALETNWATARHAHLMLLQEIERGKCSWRHPDAVEKIRIRNTARVVSQHLNLQNTARATRYALTTTLTIVSFLEIT